MVGQIGPVRHVVKFGEPVGRSASIVLTIFLKIVFYYYFKFLLI